MFFILYINFYYIGGLMEIRELKTFVTAAEYMNFSKAAEKLGYTQASVTLQIQHLEKELSVCLFDRIGKRCI